MTARHALVVAWVLLLGGGCAEDLCAGVSCTAPQRCQPQTGVCLSTCDTVKCPAGARCQESTGLCSPAETPAAPAIGELIDRVGRPGVSEILLNPLDRYRPAGADAAESRDVTLDRYNQDGDAATWSARWSPAFAASVATLDGLDGNCGNSLHADFSTPRYATLARVLSDDALYLDASVGVCRDAYLAVESRSFGAAVNDCGGRTLRADVIDATYSIVVSGAFSGVVDGATFSANVSGEFPFLGIPPR